MSETNNILYQFQVLHNWRAQRESTFVEMACCKMRTMSNVGLFRLSISMNIIHYFYHEKVHFLVGQ